MRRLIGRVLGALAVGGLALVGSSVVGAASTAAAPIITVQPLDQSVVSGQTATFTAAASGTPTPTVQWQLSTDGGTTWSTVVGLTTTTITTAALTPADNGWKVRAVFRNASGTAITSAATIIVGVPAAPIVNAEPLSPTVLGGQTATFTAGASGTPTPTVQWQISTDGGTTWTTVLGLTTPTITTAALSPAYNGWKVRAVFRNASGTAITSAATITVIAPAAPVVTVEPINQSVGSGQTATFATAASGTPAPTVQWQISTDGGATWSTVLGLTTPTITTAALTLSNNGWKVRAVFRNASGTAITSAATMTVGLPVVTLDPQNQTVISGQAATFTTAASGTPTPTVQWQQSTDFGRTWADVPSATSTTFTTSTLTGIGTVLQVRAVFTNTAGSATSDPATVTVTVSNEFSLPKKIAFDGTHLWVTNGYNNSVTELDASTGDYVQTLSGGSYGFDYPAAITFDGTHLWVSNWLSTTVTEFNASDGSWVQTLSDPSYAFNKPTGTLVVGGHLFVANYGDSVVTELNTSDGSLVQVLSDPSYGFNSPADIIFDGTHIWVTNYNGNSMTELNPDGSLVQTISDPSYGFSVPYEMAFDGTHLWVTNSGGESVTEMNASDGSLVQVLSGGSYGFSTPQALVLVGAHVWVVDEGADSVTEFNTSDGSWVQTLSGGSYDFRIPGGITYDGTHLWVTNEGNNTVTEIDPSDGSWVQTLGP